MGQIVNISGFVSQGYYVGTYITKENKFPQNVYWQNSKYSNNKWVLFCACNTGLLMRRIPFFYTGNNISFNWSLKWFSLSSKSIANLRRLMPIYDKILQFHLWKRLFTWIGTAKYWKALREYMSWLSIFLSLKAL